ncbi:MAG TPA: hypothetical protein VJT71_14985 [Pyrinomonadaceae bacterium]|nr:hypothetical protein [Pyrinomonadaceae bacterium]
MQKQTILLVLALISFSTALACAAKSSGNSVSVSPTPTPTPTPGATPIKLTTDNLKKLRWIEGSWRGTGKDQPAFFERYRFESDSVLAVDSFEDETLKKVTETTRFELKNGEFGGGSEGARYVATSLDDNSIEFGPALKVRNWFVWKQESKDAWTAIIKWPATTDKPARERTYNMERWPKP